MLCQRVHNQEEDQQGSQGLQSADKQGTKHLDDGQLGQSNAQNRAHDQTGDNTQDQTGLVPLTDEFHFPFPFSFA